MFINKYTAMFFLGGGWGVKGVEDGGFVNYKQC